MYCENFPSFSFKGGVGCSPDKFKFEADEIKDETGGGLKN
jgi:hypothetical protein